MKRFINTAVILTLIWSDILLRLVASIMLAVFSPGPVTVLFFGLNVVADFICRRGPGWAASYAVWRVKMAKARVTS
jgi:hypothetical protein